MKPVSKVVAGGETRGGKWFEGVVKEFGKLEKIPNAKQALGIKQLKNQYG
jgi:hypothetical protein